MLEGIGSTRGKKVPLQPPTPSAASWYLSSFKNFPHTHVIHIFWNKSGHSVQKILILISHSAMGIIPGGKGLQHLFKRKFSISLVKPIFSYWSLDLLPTCFQHTCYWWKSLYTGHVSWSLCELIHGANMCQVWSLLTPVTKLPAEVLYSWPFPRLGVAWRVTFPGLVSAKVISVVLLFAKPSEHKVFSFHLHNFETRDAEFFGSYIVYMCVLLLISF